MLVGFSVRNFRSFCDPQYLSFVASFDDAHEATHCLATHIKAMPRLTRTAVLFGANASGKSNLLLALATMRRIVLHSTSFTEEISSAAYTPFRLNGACPGPTAFAIDLLLRGVRYHYSFGYDAKGIVAESLHVHHSRKSQRWFGRQRSDAGGETWSAFSPSLRGPREAWRRMTHARALFLTVAGRQKAPQVRDILHWFEHECGVVSADQDDIALAPRLADPVFKTRVLGIFRALDLPVEDIRQSPGTLGPTVQFLHRCADCPPLWLDLAHESAGMRRLVQLVGPLLDAIDKGTFLAIDEISRSLHPLIVRCLLQLVHDPRLSRTSAQLMVSTHDMGLMDLDILRRDEIWLVKLDEQRASALSSLLQQSPRKHEKVAKNYLRGSFGAIPDIKFDPETAATRPERD